MFVLGATTMSSRSLLLLGISIAQSYGAIYDQVSQLPTDVYDYIVVGGSFPILYNVQLKERTHLRSLLGGTAGNVIANRLTEDSSVQVLVLEAGGRWVACQSSITHNANLTVVTEESSDPPSHS